MPELALTQKYLRERFPKRCLVYSFIYGYNLYILLYRLVLTNCLNRKIFIETDCINKKNILLELFVWYFLHSKIEHEIFVTHLQRVTEIFCSKKLVNNLTKNRSSHENCSGKCCIFFWNFTKLQSKYSWQGLPPNKCEKIEYFSRFFQ